MIVKKDILLILVMAVSAGCSFQPHISFSCEKDKKNDYILRWEVFPEVDNEKIDIFVSDNDTLFPKEATLVTSLNDYITVIKANDNRAREFFKLRVNQTLSGVITNRTFEMDSVLNFRDLGGYFTASNRQLRWGRVYRSGSLNRLSKSDEAILKSLNIKTIVDFRNEEQAERRPDRLKVENNILLPIEVGNFDVVKERIVEGSFLRGDAIVYTQDLYRNSIENQSAEYAAFFDILSDEDNYPILFHCVLGKDFSGLASYFLLRILDVPMDVIEDDYLLSNFSIDKSKITRGTGQMTENMQEALTMITKADISYLKYAISCIRKKSGSVDEYMSHELKLTPEKRARIKKNMLYANS